MPIYESFYHHIIPKIPETLIESGGGLFYNFFSHCFPFTPYVPCMIPVVGIKINSPWGLSSGWADTISKMKYISNLGAGIIFSKTITLNPRKGNPRPRIIRLNFKNYPILINSMGLPNKGLVQWSQWLKKVKILPNGFFLSTKGDSIKEWIILLKTLSPYTGLLEMNISCPNVKKGILDRERTFFMFKSIFKKIKHENIQVTVKLSPEYSTKQLTELITDLKEKFETIKAISLFNTFPVFHSTLGNPEHKGGLSGVILYEKLCKTLKYVRKVFKYTDLPIFASGGINSGEQAYNIWSNYQAFPLTLTGLLTKGPSLFKQWYLEFRKHLSVRN